MGSFEPAPRGCDIHVFRVLREQGLSVGGGGWRKEKLQGAGVWSGSPGVTPP